MLGVACFCLLFVVVSRYFSGSRASGERSEHPCRHAGPSSGPPAGEVISYLVPVILPVAPVEVQVILEPGMGQFRQFESPPSAYSYKFVGIFSCAQIDLRKAPDRELAALDEKSTSSGIAEPYAR